MVDGKENCEFDQVDKFTLLVLYEMHKEQFGEYTYLC